MVSKRKISGRSGRRCLGHVAEPHRPGANERAPGYGGDGQVTSANEPIPDGGEQVAGAAQTPGTLPWRPNRDGRRTLADAIQFARGRGIQIEDEIRFVVCDALVPADAFASYGGFRSSQMVRWQDFYVNERIPVKIKAEVLASDEAIVAVFAHEMHELNELRRLFEERETMSGAALHELIRVGVHGNLHDRAWDVADDLVRAMREQQHADD